MQARQGAAIKKLLFAAPPLAQLIYSSYQFKEVSP